MQELIEARTKKNKLFNLGGRKRRLVSSLSNVHYEDEAGALQDIDCNVENGRVHKCDYDVSLLDGKVGYAGTDPKGKQIELELLDAQAEPVIEGNVVTYPDAQESCDVVLTFLPGRIMLHRVLKDASAPKVAQFRSLRQEGVMGKLLNLGVDSEGSKTQLKVTEEASAASENGEKVLVQEWTGKVAQMDKKTRKREWTDDVEYPVVIDPSSAFTIASPTHDGFGTNYFPSFNNTQTFGFADRATAPVSRIMASYFMFTVSGIPNGYTINDAWLDLYSTKNSTNKMRIRAWKSQSPSVANIPSTYAQVTNPNTANLAAATYKPWTWLPTTIGSPVLNHIPVKTIVEELVAANDYTTSKGMLFFTDCASPYYPFPNYTMQMATSEHPTSPPQLIIDFEAPTPPSALEPDKTTYHHG